jgi:hypothetical protein
MPLRGAVFFAVGAGKLNAVPFATHSRLLSVFIQSFTLYPWSAIEDEEPLRKVNQLCAAANFTTEAVNLPACHPSTNSYRRRATTRQTAGYWTVAARLRRAWLGEHAAQAAHHRAAVANYRSSR